MSKKQVEDDNRDTSNVWSPELKFRYSSDQVIEFVRYMDFIFHRQTGVMPDLLKIVIIRSVAATMIDTGHGSNASSLSDALGIPRETVRRKCEELITDGWLLRKQNEIHAGPSITPEILEMVDENIDKFIATANKIESAAK